MSLPTHLFRLVLDAEPTADQIDELADLCGDAGFTLRDGRAVAEFDRGAGDLVSALGSAIMDTERVGLTVTAVEPIDLLWWVDVAHRVGLSPDGLEAKIRQSPIAHSKLMESAMKGYYHWGDVKTWLNAHDVKCNYDETIEAANTAVRDRPEGFWDTGCGMAVDKMTRRIRHEINKINAWKMPEQLEPYRSYIGDHGGNTVEELMFQLKYNDRLARVNLPLFAIACMAQAQVNLLTRLHRNGLLPERPDKPGGW